MKKRIITLLYTAIALLMTACVDEELPTADTPEGNLDALWQLIDER